MAADLLARGLAAKTFATVRAQSISIEECGATGSGNDQPAIQRAVDLAIANGVPKVTARLPRLEMWCPQRVQGYSASSDGVPLVVKAPVHLDFGGASITLKGLGGANRMIGQPTGGYNDGTVKPWLGGWLYIVGNPNFTRVVVENVKVDGGYSGDVYSNAPSNVTDKGIRVQDAYVGEVVLRDVELKNFAGEICYLGLVGDTHTLVENCHFHGSPQSAWNPPGAGRVTAINLQAGRAYAPAEVIGGRGHTYIGGRFYDGYTTGFFGGPDPDFDSAYPFVYATRRSDAAPPFIHFGGTRFESIPGALTLSCFTRGRIVTVDTPVTLTHAGVGHVQDVDLEIEAWADRMSNFDGFGVFGPPDLTTQVGGAPAGTLYRKTSNVDVRVRCRRTALAAAAGRKIGNGIRIYSGLFDRESVRLKVEGECAIAWALNSAPPADFELPRIESRVSYPPANEAGGGRVESWSADTAFKVDCPSVTLLHAGSGLINVSMDMTHDYAHGQRFTFRCGGTDSTKVFSFAKNAAGLRLNATRILRGTGEFLTLEFNRDLNLWCEAAYFAQTAAAEPVLIDATSGLASFSAAPWQTNNLTLAAADQPGPYGTGEAISCTNGGSFDLLHRHAPGRRSIKARVKAGSTPVVGLFFDTAVGFSQAVFNLQTGVTGFGEGVEGSVRALGSGWFLVEASAQCTNNLGLAVGGSVGETIVLYDLMLFDG